MKYNLKGLYLVTDRSNHSMSDFKKVISEALCAGVDIVQLREKNITNQEYIKIAIEIKEITDQYNKPLIINDNPIVAKEISAAGAHIGQSDNTIEQTRQILGKKSIIGISIENIEQAKTFKQNQVNYAAISPIFATNTKKDTAQPVDLDNARIIRDIINIPLFAIGGINNDNTKEVMSCGIDGICVISTIFNSQNPFEAAKILKDLINYKGS